MRASNVLGIIYSGAYDETLPELTHVRTMGSVPFAGRYRLIDFALSGMVNCGVTAVGVNTKSNYRSLMDHLGSGKAWDLSRKNDGLTILPPFDLARNGGIYRNRIEALQSMMNYFSHVNKDYVLFCDANVLCNLDYEAFIDTHIKSGADVTIAYKFGKKPKLQDLMTLILDGDKVTKVLTNDNDGAEKNYALNIIVMKKQLLERLVSAAIATGADSFGRDVIGAHCGTLDVRGYRVDEFAEMIDSMQTYYNVSMKLVSGDYRKLFKKELPIYTKVRDDMPAIYGVNSKASNSLIADGCIIKGTVENSILFRGVQIAEGAVVKNAVVMQDSFISEGASVACAVLDKNVVIKPGKSLSGADTCPLYVAKDSIV